MKFPWKKTLLATSATMVLGGSLAPLTSVQASSDGQETTQTSEQNNKETITFTNREFFEAFEETGHNVRDYLTEEEIQDALLEDQNQGEITLSSIVSFGDNRIEHSSTGGYDIYLSESVTRLAITAGGAAAAAAAVKIPVVGPWLVANGITAGKLSTAFGFLANEGVGSINGSIIVLDQLLNITYVSFT